MAQIIEYKCPCCGGIIEFDPTSQQMKCPYCETTFDPSALLDKDEALNNTKPDEMDWETPDSQWAEGETDGMNVYSCKSCGGEIIADENTGATHCPFCGNPVVLTSRFSGALRPDYVIPFKLTKEDAKGALKRFMSKKKLLPKLFSEDSHLDEVKGVYVPFWLFDAEADARMNYHATRTRTWRTGNREYTETSHFHIERYGNLAFERVPVDGSSRMDDSMMESLEPFDFQDAKPFQTAFLSGYYADKYDVTAEDSMERANDRIKRSTEQAFANTVIGYGTVVPENSSIQLRDSRAKYALYPVWLLTTSYQGKQYQFAMNGQTGSFVGQMPVDKQRYWIWHLIYTAICGGITWLILFLFFLR